MSCRDFDTYRLVRQLVRDKSKSTKEIAELTGYSRAYVSQLRADIPHVDAMKAKNRLERAAPDLLEALQLMMDRAHPAYVGDESMRDKLIVARETARAAIVKAVGEQQ